VEKLTNKRYNSFDYTCRYTTVPYFYDTEAQTDVYGIGTQMSSKTAFVSHQVKPEDTLDSLALTYYNNPTYWWIIAYFNKINDPFIKLSEKFSIIKIPSISSIVFANER
jgi:nucleoid-associated protein YgaU